MIPAIPIASRHPNVMTLSPVYENDWSNAGVFISPPPPCATLVNPLISLFEPIITQVLYRTISGVMKT